MISFIGNNIKNAKITHSEGRCNEMAVKINSSWKENHSGPIGFGHLFLYVSILILLSGASSIAQTPDVLSLDQAVQKALEANPDLAAMQARARAMAEIPVQQGALPDPQLTMRAANFPVDTFSLDQEPMTQLQIGISQALPFPGKLSLREEIAELESRAADDMYQQQRLLLIKDVKMIWWNLYYLDQAIDTVARTQNLFRQLNATAQTKYQVGKGLQQDVLLAQLELSRLFDQEITLTSMRENESIRLNILLDRPSNKAVRLPDMEKKNPPALPELDLLLAEAGRENPLIRKMQNSLDAAESRVELAEKNYYPDFMVGATYGYREGEGADGSERADFATLSLTMSLPFFNRAAKESGISQRKYELFQNRQLLQDAENRVEGKVAEALTDLKKAREEIVLLEDGIIPQARQTLDSMLAGYQVNKVDFLNVVRAQTALFNYETRYWKSYSSAYQALARLAAAVGKENIPSE